MKIYKHGDVEIRYRLEGDRGPVYVLLHGFGGGPNDWSALSPFLALKGRVILPNLKTFFSHREPLTFSQQIDILEGFVETLYERKQVNTIRLVGQSYGATLSVALRLVTKLNVEEQSLLNPMPFYPVEQVRNPLVAMLLNQSERPEGMVEFLRTDDGRKGLHELARVFRIGALGHHEISHFNDRKLQLVEKAFERFVWLTKNEDWGKWYRLLENLPERAVTRFFYSSHDSLFDSGDYNTLAAQFKADRVVEVPHTGHLLAQDLGLAVVKLLADTKLS